MEVLLFPYLDPIQQHCQHEHEPQASPWSLHPVIIEGINNPIDILMFYRK